MKSSLPKVLHRCCDVPMIEHVVEQIVQCGCSPIVVVISASEGDQVREYLQSRFPTVDLCFVIQDPPRGTGDSAHIGLSKIPSSVDSVLIVCGDVPLLRAATLTRLIGSADGVAMSMLTGILEDPSGYGRVVRDERQVVGVVEQRDATAEQHRISEVNAGTYCVLSRVLRQGLQGISSNNVQGELYLTDVVAHAATHGGVRAVCLSDTDQMLGVNTREQLGLVDQLMRQRLLQQFRSKGVTFIDPHNTFLGAHVEIARDVHIGVGVQLFGDTEVQSGARIDGPTFINNSLIASNATVHAFSHLDEARVGEHVSVGPFARLRPGACLDDGSRVGNFVEIKNSRLRRNAKAGHLSYLGDADIGVGTNIGAGTITCNYDGQHKHLTKVEDQAFIGSNTTLVAPVHVGEKAYIAAGSAITEDVQVEDLAIGRSRQTNLKNYARYLREKSNKTS